MLPSVAPELSIDGAVLRSWRQPDAAQLAAAWVDPEIARWNVVPADPSIATAERWIAGETKRLAAGVSIDLVIDDRQLGVVGEVGLSGFNATHGGALVGYWLMPEARGRGLAVAAVNALCEWAFSDLELKVIVARCDAQNLASHAVAGRCGFVYAATDHDGMQVWRRRTAASSDNTGNTNHGP